MLPARTTTTRTGHRVALALLLGGATAALSACSFGPFDDLEQRVPVARVERGGGLSSDFFGGLLLGTALPADDEGGVLLAAGTGSRPGLLSARFGTDGKYRASASSGSQYSTALDLGTHQPRSLARVLTAPATDEGPFAYVGATSVGSSSVEAAGLVVLADFRSFKALATLRPGDLAPAAETQAADFGAAVVSFALARDSSGNATSRGLLVGGRGRLWGYLSDDWASKPARHVIAGTGIPGWPATAAPESTFVTLAAGNLDGSTDGADELVIAAPDSNFVAVLRPGGGLATCADGTSGCPLAVLAPPAGAAGFGRSLLLTNLDSDPQFELLVGAPKSAGGSGAVYVYDFDSSGAATLRLTVAAPEAGEAFGQALAIGRFEGSERLLLAVGAPTASVKGAASAGRIYLYKTADLAAGDEPPTKLSLVELRDGEAGQLLGQTLTTLPFRRGEASADLLTSNGTDAALVFFANLTDQQLDLRVR